MTAPADLDAFFRERRCARPKIGLLQPAGPILDAAGEDIRRRIFMTQDIEGRAMCLRPEFTIPVCLHHIASGKPRGRYGYEGAVFRQRRDEPHEFRQAGIEDIGTKNRINADARCLADAVAMLRSLGAGKLTVTMGDQAIFEAVLSSFGLPAAWRKRLGRAFGDAERLKADLDRLSGGANGFLRDLPANVAKPLATGDREAVEKAIAAMMAKGGLSPQAGRSPASVTARLMDKAELAATELASGKREALEAFLALDIPAGRSNQKLWSFARKYQITLGKALEAFHDRTAAIAALELEDVKLRYRTGFGRRLDYYTGFVFEIRAAGKAAGERPLAGGGRYDRLLNLLGAEEETPAIGFSVWSERITPQKPARRKPASRAGRKRPAGKGGRA